MEIFKWLEDETLVSSYTIHDFRTSDNTMYINIRIVLNNSSELSYREYLSNNSRKYSFHWQDKSGLLISRWDNAPHHLNIPTYPHHRHHEDGRISASHDISFEEIIELIRTELNKKPKS